MIKENKNSIDKNEVAIIGIGFRIPSGNNDESINSAQTLFEGLMNGMDCLGEISNAFAGLLPLKEVKSFDPLFFGISPSEAPTIDPQQRLLLKCTWEALEDAPIDPISILGTNTSVFIGSSTTDYFHSNKKFSSTITKVGNNVKGYNIGDELFGLGENTTSSHILADFNKIHLKPKNKTHIEAASIPLVYLTSYYCLFYVGDFNMDQNETILIHSASGGIGLSILEILKWKSNKSLVFVTVGSDERNNTYLIIMKLIQLKSPNNGIDLIINTLSSDFMDSNFEILSSKGRIVDLSITHLNQNEYLKNINFKFNKGYHNIELTTVSRFILKNCLSIISEAIENNKLNLIPIINYSNVKVKDAIEFINKRKHIGKIVINHSHDILNELIENHLNNNNNNVHSILKENYQINSNNLGKNILITGQSGIILGILKWIIKFSPEIQNVIILSKSLMKWEMEFLINKTKLVNDKIKFHFKSIDISNYNSIENSINEIINENNNIKNIDSIFHFAFTQIACKVENINMEHLNVSHGAKTIGAINLHNLSIKFGWKFINFVISSSVASIIGSTDQCSYVCANTLLDSFSRYRHSLRLPLTCINLGPIESTGFVSKNQSISALLDGTGIIPTPINKVLGFLDLQIQNPNKFTKNNEQASLISKFDYYLNLFKNSFDKTKNSNDYKTDIGQLFIKKVSELFSIDESKINKDIRLIDYGADSLVIVQCKNWVDKEIGSNLISIQQLQNNSIDNSIKSIISTFNKRDNQNELITPKSIKNESSQNQTFEFWENEMKLDDSTFKK
ncbi:hypothetical protein ACTFIY_011275 [Dictyostelium cf. discoideum]